jgi:hypothetical protein
MGEDEFHRDELGSLGQSYLRATIGFRATGKMQEARWES